MSKFENACFLSYTSSPNKHAQEVVETFRIALEAQVSLYMPRLGVYQDRERLRPGDFFNEVLAEQLCRSVCMVLLYNPCYFDPNHPFCAQEYRAMLALEKKRLKLARRDLKARGLIIPVVIRGDDDIPEEIGRYRECISFSKRVLRATDFDDRQCIEDLERIAGIIYERWKVLRSREGEVTARCTDFALPTKEDVRDWLEEVTSNRPPSSIPGR